MSDTGIRLVALGPAPVGQWLKSYDPERTDPVDPSAPTGWVEGTDDPAEAMRFPDMATALSFARQQSTTRPLRPDGQPNRPLTAFTLGFMHLPEVPEKSSPEG